MYESDAIGLKEVFSLIHSQGRLSAIALARLTSMRTPALMTIIRQLQGKNLIITGDYGPSTCKGGKRPLLWQANPAFCNILGLDVMPHGIRAVLINFAGEVILRVVKEFSPSDPGKALSRIQKTIAEIVKETSLQLKTPRYISIAVPGVVDPVSHRIVHSTSLGFLDLDIKAQIEEEFGIATGVIRSANAGALGIQWYCNSGALSTNILYVIYNSIAGGLDLGLLLNHRLYYGSHGIAGEITNSISSLDGIIKKNADKFESETAITSLGGTASLQISDLYTGMKNGCKGSEIVLNDLIEQMAAELCRVAGLFDPEKIILGGELCILDIHSPEGLVERTTDFMKRHHRYNQKLPIIECDPNFIFSVAKGATALYLEEDASLWAR